MDGWEKNEEMPGFCSPASDTEHTMGAASRYDESVKLEGKVASIDTLKELLRHWGCGYRTAGPSALQEASAGPDRSLLLPPVVP